MSKTEKHRGKLIKIASGDDAVQEVKDLVTAIYPEGNFPSYYTDIFDCFRDKFGEEYLFYERSKTLYKMENTEMDPYEDIHHHKILPNGEIEYIVEFYNGGTYLIEVLEEIIENIQKNESTK